MVNVGIKKHFDHTDDDYEKCSKCDGTGIDIHATINAFQELIDIVRGSVLFLEHISRDGLGRWWDVTKSPHSKWCQPCALAKALDKLNIETEKYWVS